MEVQFINSFTITDNTEAVNVGRGHITGLLVNFDDPEAILDVIFHGRERTILVESIPLKNLVEINRYLRTVSVSTDKLYIDLGSIYLQSGDEIRIQLTSSTGLAQTFSVYTYSENRTPFVLNVYENILDSNTSIIQCSKLFGFADGTDNPNLALTKTPYDDYTADNVGMNLAAWANDQGLVADSDSMAILYDDVNNLVADLWIRVTGTGATNFQMINLKQMRPLGYVDASTVENMIKLADRLGKMERQDPREAKAYRHALALPKPQQMIEAAYRAQQSQIR